MKILVLGHGGHGKGTFCKMLEDIYGFKSLSSSEAAWPHIWPSVYESRSIWYDGSKPLTADIAYDLRHKYRKLLKELILLLNTPDKKTLTNLVLEQADIYDGMRSNEEFIEARVEFDVIFWIDASQRIEDDASMDIPFDAKMVYVDNNGSEEDLYNAAKDLFKMKESAILNP